MAARHRRRAPGSSRTDATSPVSGRAPSAIVLSPCGSMSMTSVRSPRSSAADARPRVIDVLPTPPLRLHTPSTSTGDTVSGRRVARRIARRHAQACRRRAAWSGQTAAMSTRLTRWGHACIRLDRGDDRLVIDPGVFSDLRRCARRRRGRPGHPRARRPPRDRAGRRGGPGGRRCGHRSRSSTLLVAAGAPADRAARRPRRRHRHGRRLRGRGAGGVARPDPRRTSRACTNVGYLVAGVLHPGDAYVDPAGRPGRRAAARRSAGRG